jgi:hypothetical protein
LDQGFKLRVQNLLGYFYLDKGLISFLQVGVLGLYTTIIIPFSAGLRLVEFSLTYQSESLQPFEQLLLGRSDEGYLLARPVIQIHGGWRPGEYDLKRSHTKAAVHTTLVCTGRGRKRVIPVILALADLSSQSIEDCPVVPFYLDVCLQLIGHSERLINA